MLVRSFLLSQQSVGEWVNLIFSSLLVEPVRQAIQNGTKVYIGLEIIQTMAVTVPDESIFIILLSVHARGMWLIFITAEQF